MQILAFFTNNGLPVTGLSPTIRIRNVATTVLVITDAAMSEIGDGHYSYDFTIYDSTLDYSIRCDGGATLTDVDRYKYAGNESYIADIETSRISTQIIGVSGDIADVNTNVLDVSGAVLDNINVDSIQIANDVWRHQVSAGEPGSAEDSLLGINTSVLGVSADIADVNTNVLEVNTNVLEVSAGLDSLSVSAAVDEQAIADAVWAEATADHSAAGSFGGILQRIVGLMHENIYIDQPIYDGDNNLTSARLRIYSSAGNVGTSNGVIGTYTITSPGDGPGRFTTWKQIKI